MGQKIITFVLLQAYLVHCHFLEIQSEGRQDFSPGGQWQYTLRYNINLDLELKGDQDDIHKTHILNNTPMYELCVDRGNQVQVCDSLFGALFLNQRRNGFFLPHHPEHSNGLTRISTWLQYKTPCSTKVDYDKESLMLESTVEKCDSEIPFTIVSNVTTFLWLDPRKALKELHQRLKHCPVPPPSNNLQLLSQDAERADIVFVDSIDECRQVVQDHIRLAADQVEKSTKTTNEIINGDLSFKRIEVITTVFTHPINSSRRRNEGEWIHNMSQLHFQDQLSSPKFIVLSASPIEYPYVMPSDVDHLVGLPNVEVRPFTNPKESQECPGILSYIVETYHELPDLMIFLHGYPFDHNHLILQHLSELFKTNKRSGLPLLDFVHLNVDNTTAQCELRQHKIRPSISYLLGLNELLPSTANTTATGGIESSRCFSPKFCCGQFLVSKEAVWRRPLSFYRMALKLSNEIELPCHELENIWQAIFRFEAYFTGLHIVELLDIMIQRENKMS